MQRLISLVLPIILLFNTSFYGENIQCPHGCGDLDRDERIRKVRILVEDCFKKLNSLSVKHEKAIEAEDKAETLLYPYFIPRVDLCITSSTDVKTGHMIEAPRVDKAELELYKCSWFRRCERVCGWKWELENQIFVAKSHISPSLASRCGLMVDPQKDPDILRMHIRLYSYCSIDSDGYDYEYYNYQSYSSVLCFLNRLHQNVKCLFDHIDREVAKEIDQDIQTCQYNRQIWGVLHNFLRGDLMQKYSDLKHLSFAANSQSAICKNVNV